MWSLWRSNQSGAAAESSDESLLQAIGKGDETAFLIVYRRRQAAVFRYGLSLSSDSEIAADALQDSFLALLREAHRLDPAKGSVLAWLFAVARNHVIRHMAARRRYLSLEEEAAEEPATDVSVLDDLAQDQLLGRLREAVPSLPVAYREVILLCDVQGLGYDEAARIIECPVGTVKSRLHRARAMLVERIRPAVRSSR